LVMIRLLVLVWIATFSAAAIAAPASEMIPLGAGAAAADEGNSKQAPVVPVQIHVVEGCDACAALLNHLAAAGVKLVAKKVDRSNCSAFPTVVYSDKTSDHGERIYNRQVPMPKSVKVEDARSAN